VPQAFRFSPTKVMRCPIPLRRQDEKDISFLAAAGRSAAKRSALFNRADAALSSSSNVSEGTTSERETRCFVRM